MTDLSQMVQTPSVSPLQSLGQQLASTGSRNGTVSITAQMRAHLHGKYLGQLSAARTNRSAFEREWYTNLAFYFGNQWITWQTTGSFYRMVVPPAPSWRSRPIRNRVRALIRKEVSRLTKTKPQGYVIPETTESEDMAAATAADQIYGAKWHDLEGDFNIKRAVWWACTCGTSFIKDWYDPYAVDKDGKPGKIKIDVLSPFHIFVPDLSLELIEEQEWIAQGNIRSATWVNQVFGTQIKEDEQTVSASPDWEQRLFRAQGLQGKMTTRKGVLVYELYIKANTDFPAGARMVLSDNEIIYLRDYQIDGPEYQHGEYCFSKIDHMQTGRFYGQSVIVDLVPPQKEFNRSRGQIIEAKNRMAKPMLVAPKGSIDAAKITSAPGQVIFYTPGFTPPAPLQIQPLPNYVLQELDRDVLDMSDMISQHEISRGEAPGRVEAATAISFLQEQDDSILSFSTSTIERAVEKLGRHILSHANEFWDDERLVKVVGTSGILEAIEFKSSDLRGNTDFRVVQGSGQPRSVAAMQAQIMDMMAQGFIPPDKGLQMMNLAATDRLWEELLVDQRHAERENLMLSKIQPPPEEEANARMQELQAQPGAELLSPDVLMKNAIQGYALPVNVYDNNLAHIAEHERWLKSSSSRTLHPIVRELAIIHTLMHYQAEALQAGIHLDMFDPRLLGVIRGVAPPPPQSMEDQASMMQQGAELQAQAESGGPPQ